MIYTLNAPLFDLLVLSVISRGDTYGYQISQILKQASNTKDSTLYPVLRRLQENGYVLTYDQQYQGRNRKILQHYACWSGPLRIPLPSVAGIHRQY